MYRFVGPKRIVGIAGVHEAGVAAVLSGRVGTTLASCAHAQKPSGAKVTKVDVQKDFKIISNDKAKLQTFCDMGKLGDQMEQANAKGDSKKVEELSLKADEFGKQLGPEYATLMDGIQGVDPESEDGQEIGSTLQALDKLCAK